MISQPSYTKGHKVTVLTGYPNYPDGKVFNEFKENPNNFKLRNVEIKRVPIISEVDPG